MAFNLDNVGRPVCKIEGGKYNNKIVSLFTEDDPDISKRFNSLKLTGAKFHVLPDIDPVQEKQRDILYITGPSGSGKSTYTANYMQKYKRILKNNPIYLFSALSEDSVLDEYNPQRILIDERMITEPFAVEDFKDSMVIFDDIDVISDKNIKEAVYQLLNEILETGRHHNVTAIVTNHLPTNGQNTKRCLNESKYITYFPFSGSSRAVKYLLTEYLGLDKKDIERIKKTKSRWATIYTRYPNFCITETEMFIFGDDE